jgi:hypothetical protein
LAQAEPGRRSWSKIIVVTGRQSKSAVVVLLAIVVTLQAHGNPRVRGTPSPLATRLGAISRCWLYQSVIIGLDDHRVLVVGSFAQEDEGERRTRSRDSKRRSPVPPAAVLLDCLATEPEGVAEARRLMVGAQVVFVLRDHQTAQCTTNTLSGERIVSQTIAQQSASEVRQSCSELKAILVGLDVPLRLLPEIRRAMEVPDGGDTGESTRR